MMKREISGHGKKQGSTRTSQQHRRRQVVFHSRLVKVIEIRPWTAKEKKDLFYSKQEIQNFIQEAKQTVVRRRRGSAPDEGDSQPGMPNLGTKRSHDDDDMEDSDGDSLAPTSTKKTMFSRHLESHPRVKEMWNSKKLWNYHPPSYDGTVC